MQCITTRTLPPTDRREQRVKATCAAGTVTLPWADNLDPPANHRAAARALQDKVGWGYHMASGQDAKGDYQHVLLYAAMAEPSTGPTDRKYRAEQVMNVRYLLDRYPATMEIRTSGYATRHLSMTARDLAALIDLFNQNDA